MRIDEIIQTDKKYYMNTFGDRTPLSFVSGQGIRLTDTEGKAYSDFFAGIATASLGYNHPALTEALCDQIKKVMHTSNVYYVENQARLAQMICENSCADRVFIGNTGAEANEAALKLAKKYFYAKGEPRDEFVTLLDSFHGRTLATVAATGQPKYQKPYAPLLHKFIHVEKNDCDALRAAISPNTAAVILELIQGESGVYPLTRDYVALARELCDKAGSLLIFDEVQTGVGRTGKLFGYENYGVEPDIFTLAKGLGGGVPIGAVCAKERVAAAFLPGDHGSTFGGNPLATRAGVTVLDQLLNHGVLENAKVSGEYFGEKLAELAEKHESIAEVRGMGLMRGVEFKDEIAPDVRSRIMDKGFLVGAVGKRILRLVPPLIVSRAEIDEFIETLDGVLKNPL